MSLLLSNYTSNGSSKTDEYGTLFGLADLISAGVIKGLAVVANSTPAMNIYVQTGSAAIGTGTAPANYSYFVKNDTSGQGQQVTIGTAAASPRIDYIVLYVDKSVAGSTAVTNNTNSVVKLADVQGTPAGSPSVPSVGQIQAAIGATNPYLILAQIAVGASVSQITNANITDLRSFAMVKPQNLGLGAASASTTAQETTTSTTYVELTTATSVTVTVNSAVLIIISCSGGNNANNGISYMSFKASGANTIAGADANAAITVLGTVNAGGFVVGMTMSKVLTGLTSGSTTFSLVYRVVSGSTGNFSNRSISVIPIG